MRLYYDLHIHSALSPCGDEDMTPNNIVNMAFLKGLDVIAVTDHNSCLNARAVMEAGKGVVKVIPGMEVTTAEEVHTLCLFPDIEMAEDMGRLVRTRMSGIKNNPEIFGRQLIMNSQDEIVGEEELLLVNAVDMDIYEVSSETKKRGGLFIPAHIDKGSYSITANLGFLPPDLYVDGLEITERGLSEYREKYPQFGIITDSDAHYLENISEKERFLDDDYESVQKIFEFLCKF